MDTKCSLQFLCILFYTLFDSSISIRHARNLIWTQTPSSKTGVSRIVGIEGDPSVWVPSGNVQVRHISAPHMGWQFRALAFHYADQTLYWTEAANKKIQGLRLNGTTETEQVFTGTSSMAEGLAVDWVSNNIYWTDSLYNWIIMSPRNSAEPVYKTIVRTKLSNPHSIAVYPQKGYLFWTDWGTVSKIEVSDLLGQNRRTIIEDDIGKPKGLVIDFDNQVLYWVDSEKDTIESSGFNGNNRRVVAYQSGSLFYGAALYKNYLFVTEQVQGHLRVYDKISGNNEINYQLGYVPDGIVMYDESVQPGNSSLCDNAGCQQICVNDPLAGPICRCGEGYTLQLDGVSCKVKRKFGQPSHIYAIRDAICQYPINLPDMSLYNITLESQCFMQNGRGHFGLTFDAREHMLYYSENVTGSIGRISLELGETGDTIMKGVGEVQGMALDWVTGNLFWTDKTYKQISMARKDGLYPVVIVEDLSEPVGIAVHPERGTSTFKTENAPFALIGLSKQCKPRSEAAECGVWSGFTCLPLIQSFWRHINRQIFWTDRSRVEPKIEKANMDGSERTTIVNSSMVDQPNHVFLDYNTNRLYWADSGLYSVRCVDLETFQVDVIYENVRQMVTFFGISRYQDYLMWTDNTDMKNGIHAARLDKLEKVRGIIHPHAGFASDLITFDINNQPEMKSSCGTNNGFCEQLCIPTSNVSKICACATGFKLDDDLRSCSSRVTTDNYLITVDSYQRQLYQIEVDTGDVNAIPLTKSYKGVALDINPITNTIYWTDNQDSVIMSAGIDGFGEAIFRKLPNGSVCDGIAVDYVNQLLFYTDTFQDVIVVISLKNPNIYKTVINDTLDEPRDIIVDAKNGKIYWTDWGWEPKIEGATMDGGNRSIIMRLLNGSWPNALTWDSEENTLYWMDAKSEVIGRINLDTGMKKVVYSEPRAHFFGMTLMGQYLYITDWFRKHVSKLNKEGGQMERVGPSKFSRLNGIAAYQKSEIKIVISKCLSSTCSHLCLPVSSDDYKCACSDEGKNAATPCKELNPIDNNIFVLPKRTRVQVNSPVMTCWCWKLMMNMTLYESQREKTYLAWQMQQIKQDVSQASAASTVTGDYVQMPRTLMCSVIFRDTSRPQVGLIIGMIVLGLVIAVVIGFVTIYLYRRYRSADIPHDILVEDSRVDSFYRITFPDTSQDEANFDSGIENPSFTCSAEDVRTSGNIVHYSPL